MSGAAKRSQKNGQRQLSFIRRSCFTRSSFASEIAVTAGFSDPVRNGPAPVLVVLAILSTLKGPSEPTWLAMKRPPWRIEFEGVFGGYVNASGSSFAMDGCLRAHRRSPFSGGCFAFALEIFTIFLASTSCHIVLSTSAPVTQTPVCGRRHQISDNMPAPPTEADPSCRQLQHRDTQMVSPFGVGHEVPRLELDAPLVVLLEFRLEPLRLEHLGNGGLRFCVARVGCGRFRVPRSPAS